MRSEEKRREESITSSRQYQLYEGCHLSAAECGAHGGAADGVLYGVRDHVDPARVLHTRVRTHARTHASEMPVRPPPPPLHTHTHTPSHTVCLCACLSLSPCHVINHPFFSTPLTHTHPPSLSLPIFLCAARSSEWRVRGESVACSTLARMGLSRTMASVSLPARRMHATP
jgi:hypothetical protein